jgi:hypothetical protein
MIKLIIEAALVFLTIVFLFSWIKDLVAMAIDKGSRSLYQAWVVSFLICAWYFVYNF